MAVKHGQEERSEDHKPIGEWLIELGAVDEDSLHGALEIQRQKGGVIGQILIEQGLITPEVLIQALSAQHGMESVDLNQVEIDPEAVKMVSVSMAQVYRIVPISFVDNVLTIAMADPQNFNALDDLRFMLNCEIAATVAAEGQVMQFIEQLYGNQRESISELLKSMSGEEMQVLENSANNFDAKNIEAMVNAAPSSNS